MWVENFQKTPVCGRALVSDQACLKAPFLYKPTRSKNMKIQVISTALASFALANIITLPAHALSIYQLQGNQFAIICNDGTGYRFSGSANGAQEAGALLCAEHGGIVDV